MAKNKFEIWDSKFFFDDKIIFWIIQTFFERPWSIALGIFNIGGANKVLGNKLGNKGIKVLKKTNLKKTETRHDMRIDVIYWFNWKKKSPNSWGKWGQVWDGFVKKGFSSMHLQIEYSHGCFWFQDPFFHDFKHLLFPCIFNYKRIFFLGIFCINLYWNQKKAGK